jgi:predicted MPP superfamily phosphohydrolase
LDAALTETINETRPVTASGAAPRFHVERRESGKWLQLGEIRSFELNRITIFIEQLPASLSGFRVIHLSDLHLRPVWYGGYDLLHQRLHDDPADLIVVSGDFVEHRADHRKTLPFVQRFVSGLRSRLGTWGILGNHDGDLLGPRLRDWGVHLLADRVSRMQNHEATIELIGIRSVHRKDLCDAFLRSVPPLEPSVPRMVLSHFPDSIRRLTELEAHVVLAGHTHGGQVCLPGGLPIITHDSLPRRMSRGVHAFGDKLLVVNRGFGYANLPLRVFCPPEVIELKFQRHENR